MTLKISLELSPTLCGAGCVGDDNHGTRMMNGRQVGIHTVQVERCEECGATWAIGLPIEWFWAHPGFCQDPWD